VKIIFYVLYCYLICNYQTINLSKYFHFKLQSKITEPFEKQKSINHKDRKDLAQSEQMN